MPIGTISNEVQHVMLKSAPADPNLPGDEDGFVDVRPLPYGMKLERRDKSTRMRLEQIQQNTKKKSIGQNEPQVQKIEIESESAWAGQFDFAYCVVDHNLTDPNGTKLDFANPMAFKSLDPKIGTEIEQILTALNGDDLDEASLEDFIKPPTQSSQVESTPTLNPGEEQISSI